jgi:hypothetical protein
VPGPGLAVWLLTFLTCHAALVRACCHAAETQSEEHSLGQQLSGSTRNIAWVYKQGMPAGCMSTDVTFTDQYMLDWLCWCSFLLA